MVRRAIKSEGRKNGKTTDTAVLALAHLVGPEAIPNDEIYSAANDAAQAALVFKVAAQMVRAEPELSSRLGVVDSTKTIVNYELSSVYRAISAEAGTKHGLNPSVVIYDELAQAKSRALYDVLDTSMGGREEPLFIVISTQSNDPQHILSQLIDDALSGNDPSIVCHLYAVPEDHEDIYDPACWRWANPALGDFLSLENVRALARKAKRMPAEEPKFRNLVLNQRVSPVSTLMARAEWMACEGAARIEDKEDIYLALDLSSVRDLTALVGITSAEPVRVLPRFWKPEELIEEHSTRDFGGGNRRYQEWRAAGHLEASPGRSIDPVVVARAIAELTSQYNVLGLAYDRWRIADLLRAFDSVGLTAYKEELDKDGRPKPGVGLRLVPWGQGFRDMGPAIDALELLVTDRELEHPGNPVLNWNMGNAIAVADPAGNRKIDKSKVRFRIDGAVALAMAAGLRARDRKLAGPAVDVGDFLRNMVSV